MPVSPLPRSLLLLAAALGFAGGPALPLRAEIVLPELLPHLVCRYDFEHPVLGDPTKERDLGLSGTVLDLVNGGAAMRVGDGAFAGSAFSLQTRQVNPALSGQDDWKAGVYQAGGVPTLQAFSAVSGVTLLGWVKPTGTNPTLNSGTADPADFYSAVGLFGLLAGNSDGHSVRALVEVIAVSGTLRLVALGRRLDSGNSYILAATADWQTLLPANTWTHLAATFDFDRGTMALYRNGLPLAANYTTTGDPWAVNGGAEPDLTSATRPAGLKIGGSYPQNTQEFNAFNGRFDELMFFDTVLTATEIQQQYAAFLAAPAPALPVLTLAREGAQLTLSWPSPALGFALENTPALAPAGWATVATPPSDNGTIRSVTLPLPGPMQFFRLSRP